MTEKRLKELKRLISMNNLDGYIIPKNDAYFSEFSFPNRLKTISNFSGSAGLAVILKKKNYLFTDGRYAIQSQIESGKNFKIVDFQNIVNCALFKNVTLGIDPKLFTYGQIKKFFLKNNKIKFIDKNLVDEIERKKNYESDPFFSLSKDIVGESHNSKINKISKYLKKK